MRVDITWFISPDKRKKHFYSHYDDVIVGAIASQITSLTIVYSTDYSGAYQSKHQSSASLAFVRGIHRGPVNSPHKWPVTRKMFPFDDVIMILNWDVFIPGLLQDKAGVTQYVSKYPHPISSAGHQQDRMGVTEPMSSVTLFFNIFRYQNHGYLLNIIIIFDLSNMNVIRESNRYFAFLHSITVSG